MEQFVHTIVTFPVVPLTVGLGITLCYWLFVILGAASFGHVGHGHDAIGGALKGVGEAAHGAIKGVGEAAHGAIKGVGEAAHGAVKGAAEAVTGSAKAAGAKVQHVHADTGILSAFGLGKIPITITGSGTMLFGWMASIFGVNLLGTTLPAQLAVLAGALVAGFLCTAVALQPLRRVFDGNQAASRADLRGKVCVISSGHVEKKFGTATIEDGGAGLMIHVTCTKENPLKRGDRALIIDFDAATDSYEIEPIDWLLPQEVEALNDPARAGEVLDARVRQR